MRRFYQQIAFRIWFPYALVLLILIGFVTINYPNRQARLFRENKERELKELAKTVALGVELSLSANDFEGLKRTVDFVSGANDFEFVSILEEDTITKKKTVFATFPDLPESQVLVRDENKYVYQEFDFTTSEFTGCILIAASREKIDALVWELNRPVYVILPLVFVVGLLVFFFIARQITRPIFALTESAHELEKGKYDISIPGLAKQDEIGELSYAFDSLRKGLIELRQKNQQLTTGLESEVQLRTKDLNDALTRLENLNKISKFGYYTYYVTEDNWTHSDSINDIMGFTPSYPRTFAGWVELIVPEDQEVMAAYFKNLIETQERNPVLRDWQIIRPIDGQRRWVTATTDFVLDAQGKAVSFSGIIQDITDRKLIEEEISRLSLVAKYTSNLVVITDPHRKIIWVNDSFEKLTGYPKEEVIGMNPNMFQFEKTDPETRKYIRECLEQELPIDNVEILNRGKYGNEYWLNLNIVPIREESGLLRGYIAVESDISERKMVDIALRDSELRMRQTMDAALDAIIIMDLEGIIRFWNQQAATIFGFSKEEAIGVRLSELIIPDQYKQAHERGMAHYRNTGEGPVLNKTIEIIGLRKGNIEFPIDISIVPIDQDGIRLFCAFIRDITVRKQQEQIREEAQQALLRNEEELRKVNETLEQKVLENTKKNLDLSRMIVDQEKLATVGEISAGIAHDLNTPLSSIKAGAESVSYSLETLIGQQVSQADPELLTEALSLAKPIVKDIYLGGLQLRQESQRMESYLRSLQEASGLSDELRSQMADKLVRCRIAEEDSDSIRRILTSRDPIAVLNLIQQIQTIRTLLDSIRISVDRASKVIRDVRSFIKKDAQASQQRILIHDNISVVLNIFHYELRRDVTLDFRVDPDHIIMGYEVKLFQLWSNLIKNALDAMDEETDKQLVIRSEKTAAGVSVSVENTGPEIPAAIISQIFRKFFTTKHHKSGTGLGLSIVKNVADEHGATISVQSANRRTVFTITFPSVEA